VSTVDFAHASGANGPHDLMGSDSGAGGQAHREGL
jgi:hypothetical protein